MLHWSESQLLAHKAEDFFFFFLFQFSLNDSWKENAIQLNILHREQHSSLSSSLLQMCLSTALWCQGLWHQLPLGASLSHQNQNLGNQPSSRKLNRNGGNNKVRFCAVIIRGGLTCSSSDKESTCNVRDLGSIPGLGRSPGEGKGYPLWYSGLENSMDCVVHEVSKSWTQLSDLRFHFSHLWIHWHLFSKADLKVLMAMAMGRADLHCLFVFPHYIKHILQITLASLTSALWNQISSQQRQEHNDCSHASPEKCLSQLDHLEGSPVILETL